MQREDHPQVTAWFARHPRATLALERYLIVEQASCGSCDAAYTVSVAGRACPAETSCVDLAKNDFKLYMVSKGGGWALESRSALRVLGELYWLERSQ